MPTTLCPNCAGEIQFPDYFATTVIACPRPGCGKPVQLPHADGTPYVPPPVPVPPPLPTRPEPAAEYYLRRSSDPDLVVGPLARSRVRQMAGQGKIRPDDELSANRRIWWRADRIDPELFGLARSRDRYCPGCGARLADDVEMCLTCNQDVPAADQPGKGYGVGAPVAPRVGGSASLLERVLTAPEPLTEIASARADDAVLGANHDGWMGLWSVADGKRLRTWEFDAGKSVRLAIADKGGRAVVAVTNPRFTRLYLADFDFRRLRDLADLDGGIRALGISPDGKHLGLVDDETEVRLYRVDPWKRLDRFPVEGTRFAFGLAADRLAAADDDGRVTVWDLVAADVERELCYRRDEPACPRRPLRMAFSRTGGRLFVATGEVVEFPTMERQAGTADYGLAGLGGLAGARAGDALATGVQNARAAELQAHLDRVTTLRCWDLEKTKVTADFGGVFPAHRTGIADAYFWPWGSAAATVGETNAHAWDLASGRHLGPLLDVTEPADVRAARAECRSKHGPLIRRIEFSRDGEHALVLVAGSRDIRVVRWPEAHEQELPADF
ncbi:MAG: hypothetical protein J2P46_21720, partial [Zavarzinella sp.]|nr:hypothetical protein [Zavarzinella sp.]